MWCRPYCNPVQSLSAPVALEILTGIPPRSISTNRFYESLSLVNVDQDSLELEEEFDYIDTTFSTGMTGYVDEDFFLRKNEVGSIIISREIPVVSVRHFRGLKDRRCHLS
jgi:hypothetical protein